MEYKNIIFEMTLDEKVSLLSGKDFWQTVEIERLGIPSMTLADGPHGIRRQAGEADHLGLNQSLAATCFPTAAAVANSWNTELGVKVGSLLGEEASAQGVNVLLGPGLNIKRSPLCGRNFEYFSEDPYLSGKMAAGYIRGIQSQGVAACPKHFAVNSQELRRMSNDSVVDERTFREIYTTGFEIAVKEGKAQTIMSAYNRINGIYANENTHLLQEILVDEWGFDGIVVSDWGASNSHVDGVVAGSHLEMPTTGKYGQKELIEAVKNGRLSEELLDQRVDELLKVIFQTKIEGNHPDFDKEKHHQEAQKVAEECIVLLKNDDSILPLIKGAKVAVIGDFAETPRYQGAGSSAVNPTKLDNALSAIKKSGLEMVGYEPGFERSGKQNKDMKRKAVELAKNADIVLLYMGLDEISETEGQDRLHMELAPSQVDVLMAVAAVNPNIIIVMSAGSVVEMPWISKCKGLLHGYLTGQAGAAAMLNVITGKVCPSGRLSESYPIKYKDTPAYNYYPGEERTSEYREGLFVGYRYYVTAGIPVQFPFGYGLSYTAFSYSDLKADSEKVVLTVSNVGDRDGAEVVQIYIAAKNSQIYRPARELKGFEKVFLKAGESKTVTISLDDKAFRYYNAVSGQWETEEGTYIVMASLNAEDIVLQTEVSVKGVNCSAKEEREELPVYYNGKICRVSDAEFTKLLGHPIPNSSWDRKAPLDINDSVCQMYYAKSRLARLVYHLLTRIKDKSIEKGKPNLNILFIYNIPFRGIAKMTGGMVSMEMAEAILEIVNGHFCKGITHLIRGFFRNIK